MSAILKTATSLACLAAVVLAGPINTGSLSRREWTDCPTGKVFYVCANGYRGCFEKDPCALPPIATTSIAVPVPPTPTPTCESGSIWQPTMYNLSPSQPDLSQPAVSQLEIEVSASQQLEQVAVFRGIPSGAKTCNLMWAQAAEAERTFVVDGSGLTAISALTGFPGSGSAISENSIKPFEPSTVPTHSEFTYWDKQTKGAANHTVGQISCGEEAWFKLSIDTMNGDGRVYLGQDQKNGFYITYTC